MPPKYVAPFVVWILTLALSVTPATAECQACLIYNMYYGSCGALMQKSSCWQGEYCCAASSSDCCELNGGALAGVIIAILVALIGAYAFVHGSAAPPGRAPPTHGSTYVQRLRWIPSALFRMVLC